MKCFTGMYFKIKFFNKYENRLKFSILFYSNIFVAKTKAAILLISTFNEIQRAVNWHVKELY